MNQASTQAAERREYFRITDQVALTYRIVDEQDIARALNEDQPALDMTSILASCAGTTLDLKHAVDKCRRDFPEVAACLEVLNAKMDLLVRLMLASGKELPDHPTHEVDLSASGLGFRSAHELPAETLLEMKLLFFPSFTHILTYGRVVRCYPDDTSQDEFSHTVAVEFTHLEETQKELLIRQVLQRESALLREARDTPVSDASG